MPLNGLYTVYVCMHTCMCVYMYVIFTSKLILFTWPIVCRVHNPFTFLLFSSDLSTHQSASEERVQQLQEKLEAANKMCQEKDQKIAQLETKLQSQEAEITTLRCTLVVIWNTCTCRCMLLACSMQFEYLLNVALRNLEISNCLPVYKLQFFTCCHTIWRLRSMGVTGSFGFSE